MGFGKEVDDGGSVASEIEEDLRMFARASAHEARDVGAHGADDHFGGVDGVFVKRTSTTPCDHVFDFVATDFGDVVVGVGVTKGRGGLHGDTMFVGKGIDAFGCAKVGSEGFVDVGRFAKGEDLLAHFEMTFGIAGCENDVVVDDIVERLG